MRPWNWRTSFYPAQPVCSLHSVPAAKLHSATIKCCHMICVLIWNVLGAYQSVRIGEYRLYTHTWHLCTQVQKPTTARACIFHSGPFWFLQPVWRHTSCSCHLHLVCYGNRGRCVHLCRGGRELPSGLILSETYQKHCTLLQKLQKTECNRNSKLIGTIDKMPMSPP